MTIAAVVLAIKYNDDLYYDNAYYARVGGITFKELNDLEREMLSLLGYELYVAEELYNQFVNRLEIYGSDMELKKWPFSLVETSNAFSKQSLA